MAAQLAAAVVDANAMAIGEDEDTGCTKARLSFVTEAERAVAQATFRVIQTYENLPGSAQLLTANIQAEIVRRVEESVTSKQHHGKPWIYAMIPHDVIADNITLAGIGSQFKSG